MRAATGLEPVTFTKIGELSTALAYAGFPKLYSVYVGYIKNRHAQPPANIVLFLKGIFPMHLL